MSKITDEQINQLFNRINGLEVVKNEAKKDGNEFLCAVASNFLKTYN